jgi:hypothetical protein
MDDSEFAQLQDEAEENRYRFLQTDLELCNTFLDLAQTELKIEDRDAAQRLIDKAEQGVATVQSFIEKIHDTERRAEIAQKLTALGARIESIRAAVDKA